MYRKGKVMKYDKLNGVLGKSMLGIGKRCWPTVVTNGPSGQGQEQLPLLTHTPVPGIRGLATARNWESLS